MEKLFHPTIEASQPLAPEPESLEMAEMILHDLGWFTQQCGIEKALENIRWLQSKMPDAFLKGCATGLSVCRNARQ